MNGVISKRKHVRVMCSGLGRNMIALVFTLLFLNSCNCMIWGPDRGGDLCDEAIGETAREDRATVVDETSVRLHGTWLSQECEIRTGPEYVIRKYTFYENGTFMLTRFHYAEDSCSVATHTVTAIGSIKLLSPSLLAPGATEARYHLDAVYVTPLNRQVAYKIEHRVNVTCTPQAKWRPYSAQLIYEQSPRRFDNPLWEGPRHNSLQVHQLSRNRRGVNCLEPIGIDFGELKLLRVHKKSYTSKLFAFGSNGQPRVELLLGSLSPNVLSRKSHRSTSLQPTVLLRSDSTNGCPICGVISRGTMNSPPILHEAAALPALLGGSWLSSSCESFDGGVWLRRQLQIHSGDKLWAGRWNYFADPQCTVFLYGISGAGSYVQRATRQRRHYDLRFDSFDDELYNEGNPSFDYNEHAIRSAKKESVSPSITKRDVRSKIPFDDRPNEEILSTLVDSFVRAKEKSKRQANVRDSIYLLTSGKSKVFDGELQRDGRLKRSLEEEHSYRRFLRDAQPSLVDSFTAMLRGNQRRDEDVRKSVLPPPPAGTTELDLHVAESLLIPGDMSILIRCGGDVVGRLRTLVSWPRSCVPHSLEAPSTLGLRARVGVNWHGQYTLLLGRRDDNLWDAPLLQCGPASSHNPELRAHLRRSVGLRYGLISSFASRNVTPTFQILCLLQMFLSFVYWTVG